MKVYLTKKVTKSQWLSTLDFVLKATTARWWGTHKQSISEWEQHRRLLDIIFGEEINYIGRKYTILIDHVKHIEYCRTTWQEYPWQEWVHHFIHTLDMIPRNWYTSVELKWGTLECEKLSSSFTHIFEFIDDHPFIDVALQVMKGYWKISPPRWQIDAGA